ncbi:hypothetical protein VTL71DRAFT_9180 [Oculimacula yallundae]|uniref:Uncharacterized protein n=1 Tax=Oculimacula yallundae TaxID=86028 RepID=A0ABR4BSA4_9HELO
MAQPYHPGSIQGVDKHQLAFLNLVYTLTIGVVTAAQRQYLRQAVQRLKVKSTKYNLNQKLSTAALARWPVDRWVVTSGYVPTSFGKVIDRTAKSAH